MSLKNETRCHHYLWVCTPVAGYIQQAAVISTRNSQANVRALHQLVCRPILPNVRKPIRAFTDVWYKSVARSYTGVYGTLHLLVLKSNNNLLRHNEINKIAKQRCEILQMLNLLRPEVEGSNMAGGLTLVDVGQWLRGTQSGGN